MNPHAEPIVASVSGWLILKVQLKGLLDHIPPQCVRVGG